MSLQSVLGALSPNKKEKALEKGAVANVEPPMLTYKDDPISSTTEPETPKPNPTDPNDVPPPLGAESQFYDAFETKRDVPKDEGSQPSRPSSAQSLHFNEINESSYDPVYRDAQVQATLRNPWGGFMLPRHIATQRDLKKKVNVEDSRQYCKDFTRTVMLSQRELDATIQRKATDIAEALFERMRKADLADEADREKKRAASRHFSQYLTQAAITVPTDFSDKAQLNSESKFNTALKVFPSKTLFNGKKGIQIHDFLEDCNRAQANLRLTRSEFKDLFIKCMSGDPQHSARNSFRLGHSIEQVYRSLTMAYSNLITPEDANAKLATLKAPKTINLSKLVTIIQNLANRATANYQIQKEKDSVYNTLCIETMKRCLPEASQTLLSKELVRVTADIGRSLDFMELTMILYPHSKVINTDIERSGVAANYNGNMSPYLPDPSKEDKDNRHNKHGNGKSNGNNSKHQKPTGSVNEISAKPASDNQNRYSKGKQNQDKPYTNKKDGNKDYHIQTGNNNKRYCSACGQNNHNNSDGCKLLRDDMGRVIQQGATSGPCEPCQKKLGKQLLHSDNLCPGRPAMMKLYKEQKCKPMGPYKQLYEDWLAKHTDKNTSSPTGRVNMIQLSYNTGHASVLAVDTEGLEGHTLTRKVYITLGVARPNLAGDHHITGMYDTAADQSLISRSYFADIFGCHFDDVDKHIKTSSMRLVSYSGHSISVSGEVDLLIKLTPDGPHRPIKFAVVSDKFSKVTPLILGMTAIKQLQLSLSFNEDEPEAPPFVYTHFNPGQPLNTAYLSDLERQTASNQDVNLQPGESKFLPVTIPHRFGIYPDMEVIMSEDNLPTHYNQGIKIYPTKSDLKVNEQNSLTGYVYATNITNQEIKSGLAVAYLEPASLYDVKDVDYTFPEDKQIIHEIGLLNIANPQMNKGTNTQYTEFGTVNRVQLDLSKLPIYTYHQTSSNVINIIQKTFPEQDGYIANPDAINNDVPEPNTALSDMRSSIEEILEPASQ